MEIRDRQQLGFAIRQPLRPRRALTLRAMAISASNGLRPLLALWVKFVMVSQRSSGRRICRYSGWSDGASLSLFSP
jgi:hypothetical protein